MPMNVDRRPPPAAGTLFSLLAVAFGTLFSAIVIWLAFDQNMLLTSMDELQTRTLPQTIEQQRLARNLEVLRLEGERVLHRDNPSERRQALFVVSLIAGAFRGRGTRI